MVKRPNATILLAHDSLSLSPYAITSSPPPLGSNYLSTVTVARQQPAKGVASTYYSLLVM